VTDQFSPHSLLPSYGYTERIAALFRDHFPDSRLRPARVVRTDRGRVLLAADGGLLHLTTGRLPQQPATGDWVAYDAGRPASAGGPSIAGLLPRFSVLSRKQAYDPLSAEQILAANMDLIGIVAPFDRPLSPNRLERTLVAAWDSGAVPLVILTKADLSGQHDEVAAQIVEQAAGADVLTTSAETGDGIDALAAYLGAGRSMVLLGPSGAGKSSLINALAGRHVQDAGAVRAGDGKGRHTTTVRELIPLPDGAVLMDTPGIRGFALWDAEDVPVAGSTTASMMRSPAAPSGRRSPTAAWSGGAGRATGRWNGNWPACTCGRTLQRSAGPDGSSPSRSRRPRKPRTIGAGGNHVQAGRRGD
jgi:ribosome biogenesis GTPase